MNNPNAGSLQELGLEFNAAGQLVWRKDGSKYKPDRSESERIGNLVIAHVQQVLVSKYGFQRCEVDVAPSRSLRGKNSKPRHSSQKSTMKVLNALISSDFKTNTDKCVMIIQGSGKTRAGIYTRFHCVAQSLEIGSMIPDVVYALANGYSVIILNPNENSVSFSSPSESKQKNWQEDSKNRVVVPGNESPENHVVYVWDNYILPMCAAQSLVILAHSYAGNSVLFLFEQRPETAYTRVRAVAITDSAHVEDKRLPKKVDKSFVSERFINWITSAEPVDKVLPKVAGMPTRSAGTLVHELTPSSARTAMWSFLDQSLKTEKSKRRVKVEVCVGSVEDVMAARDGGADRVELCGGLEVGGTTPSYGTIRSAILQRDRAARQKNNSFQVYVIIRPRAGNFEVSLEEFKVMKEEIDMCKREKVDGVVFGVLKKREDGGVEIDKEKMKELVGRAKPEMQVTFHRAFDVIERARMREAVETLISLGVDRVLTSGKRKGVGEEEARQLLRELAVEARGRIKFVWGGGIRMDNLGEMLAEDAVEEIHVGSCVRESRESCTAREKEGDADFSCQLSFTSVALVRQLLSKVERT